MNILKSLILTNTYITQKIQKEKTKIFLFKNRRNNGKRQILRLG